MNSPLDLVDPAFHITVNQRFIEMFRVKKSICYTYKVLRGNGTTFWAEANINPIINPATREVINLITVVRDVSERMKHEEELSENSRQKEYLLHEIHNRVKNNFAILISLMNMQRDQSADPELSSSLNDLQLRVRTMSLVHEQLYQSQEISQIPFNNYLHHLAIIISSSFKNSRIRLQTEISPCNVAIEIALPLGLIINELITNAYKYAFPGEMSGTIWVKLLPDTTDKYCIVICDDGIGLPQDFTMNTTNSMGSQIVGILVEQIEATLEVTSDRGACFRIIFSTAQEK
jgi:two-component sensor histidine kinase